MKKILRFTLIMFGVIFSSMKCYATSQCGEIVIINGKRFEMLTTPINNPDLYNELQKYLPKDVGCTACWRDYIGEWELKNNKLYLNKIYNLDSRGIERETEEYFGLAGGVVDTKNTFDKYKTKDGIFASWFTGELRVVEGDQIWGINDRFMRYYEKETFYKIEKGNVISKRETKNSILKSPIPSKKYASIIVKNFNKAQFPELRGLDVSFRYLANVDGSFNSLVDARIGVITKDSSYDVTDKDHPYMKELLNAIKVIPQWEVFMIDGKPVPSPMIIAFGKREDSLFNE